MKTLNKKMIVAVIAVAITTMSFGVAFADNISNAVAGVVLKVSAAFDAIGNKTVNSTEQQMTKMVADTKSKIKDVQNKSEIELTNDLEAYKKAQLDKKAKEMDKLVNDVSGAVNQAKTEKSEAYKKKIDDSINAQYDQLLVDLTNGN